LIRRINHLDEERFSRAQAIFKKAPVDVAYLFGSQLESEKRRANSDYDFAVLFSNETPESERGFIRGELIDRLFSIFGRDQVDVIDLETVPLSLQFTAIQPCHVILCRNEQRRVQFETDIARRYHDHKPYFDRALKFLTEQMGSI